MVVLFNFISKHQKVILIVIVKIDKAPNKHLATYIPPDLDTTFPRDAQLYTVVNKIVAIVYNLLRACELLLRARDSKI